MRYLQLAKKIALTWLTLITVVACGGATGIEDARLAGNGSNGYGGGSHNDPGSGISPEVTQTDAQQTAASEAYSGLTSSKTTERDPAFKWGMFSDEEIAKYFDLEDPAIATPDTPLFTEPHMGRLDENDEHRSVYFLGGGLLGNKVRRIVSKNGMPSFVSKLYKDEEALETDMRLFDFVDALLENDPIPDLTIPMRVKGANPDEMVIEDTLGRDAHSLLVEPNKPGEPHRPRQEIKGYINDVIHNILLRIVAAYDIPQANLDPNRDDIYFRSYGLRIFGDFELKDISLIEASGLWFGDGISDGTNRLNVTLYDHKTNREIALVVKSDQIVLTPESTANNIRGALIDPH